MLKSRKQRGRKRRKLWREAGSGVRYISNATSKSRSRGGCSARMRVGIDYHGTAQAHPGYFAEVMSVLRQSGHSVGIVTAAPWSSRERIRAEMRELGLPDPDFMIMKQPVESFIPNIAWKHMVMRRDGIDALFDDFDTGIVRLVQRV